MKTTQAGNGDGGALDAAALQRFGVRLDERAATLRDEIEAVRSESDDTPSSVPMSHVEDSGEQGEQLIRHAIRHEELERDVGELRDVMDAKARLAQGSYGLCIDCGIDIPLARLEVQPAAARCLQCQERYEQTTPTRLQLPPVL
jgi:DnaK suppressor protein